MRMRSTGAAGEMAGPRGSSRGRVQHEELRILVGVARVGDPHAGDSSALDYHGSAGEMSARRQQKGGEKDK